jgi:phage shock protein PspC (stress-responsive transcriptional regulator)
MARKLERSSDSIIGGVCGGIANYFNIDPSIVRVISALLIFSPLPAILTYLLMWIIVPEELNRPDTFYP